MAFPLGQSFYRDQTTINYLHVHLVPCQQAHAKEWLCVGRVCLDSADLPVPENSGGIDIKEPDTPITEHGTLTTALLEPKGCDQQRRQRQ